jgi:hypothetical protein
MVVAQSIAEIDDGVTKLHGSGFRYAESGSLTASRFVACWRKPGGGICGPSVRKPRWFAERGAVVRSTKDANARKTDEYTGRCLRQQLIEFPFSSSDLTVDGIEQAQVRGQDPLQRVSLRSGQRQHDLGGRDDLFSLRSAQEDTAVPQIAAKTFGAQANDAFGFGYFSQHQPARTSIENVAETTRQPGEDEIKLGVDLLTQRLMGPPLATPMCNPGRLLGHGIGSVLRWPASAPH